MEGVKVKTIQTPSEMEETETQGRKRKDMMSNRSGKKQAGKIEKQKKRKAEQNTSREIIPVISLFTFTTVVPLKSNSH